MEAAKNLRMEQQKQIDINERITEQRGLVSQLESHLVKLGQDLKDTQSTIGGRTAEAVLGKMEQEHKMNKYLATENLPKVLETLF